MGKSILITGGARSGKSSFAEGLAKGSAGRVLYIATSIPFDEEMENRVKRHRDLRPAGWDTYEGYKCLGPVIEKKDSEYNTILLDCITVMVTNLLLDNPGLESGNADCEAFEEAERSIQQEIESLMRGIKKSKAATIMVTNEIGSGIVPENTLGRAFRDIAGRVNQYLAEHCDEVYVTICGIPLKLK